MVLPGLPGLGVRFVVQVDLNNRIIDLYHLRFSMKIDLQLNLH